MSARSICPMMLCSALALAALACGKSEKYSARPESAAGSVTSPAATRDSTKKAVAAVPKSVDAVGTHGEDLYDEVKAGNWKKAAALLDSLRTATAALPSDVASDARNSLSALVDSLQNDIASKRRTKAIVDANRVTYISAQMVRPYTSSTPVQVLLLDYEGRELEIWSAARDAAKLATTKRDLRTFWDEIRPEVEKRNAAQAKHTEALVARIDKAATTAELRKLTTPFLDEVDLLEKVFTNQ